MEEKTAKVLRRPYRRRRRVGREVKEPESRVHATNQVATVRCQPQESAAVGVGDPWNGGTGSRRVPCARAIDAGRQAELEAVFVAYAVANGRIREAARQLGRSPHG